MPYPSSSLKLTIGAATEATPCSHPNKLPNDCVSLWIGSATIRHVRTLDFQSFAWGAGLDTKGCCDTAQARSKDSFRNWND
jgi:hypothetical protein